MDLTTLVYLFTLSWCYFELARLYPNASKYRLRSNESAYDRYMIRPRVLRDLSNLDTSTTLFGRKVRFPFGYSPTAFQTLAHPEGELATSKACAESDTLMSLSTYSTLDLEQVISHRKQNPYAMQMSLLKNKLAMIRLTKRAEGEFWTR